MSVTIELCGGPADGFVRNFSEKSELRCDYYVPIGIKRLGITPDGVTIDCQHWGMYLVESTAEGPQRTDNEHYRYRYIGDTTTHPEAS